MATYIRRAAPIGVLGVSVRSVLKSSPSPEARTGLRTGLKDFFFQSATLDIILMLGGGLDVFINFLRVEPDINYTHVGWGRVPFNAVNGPVLVHYLVVLR